MLAGAPGIATSKPAWDHVYRSLKHSLVSKKCGEKTILAFPDPIQDFAILFRDLQFEREKCDYRAEYNVVKSTAEGRIEQVRKHIAAFEEVDEKDRRAFAVWVVIESTRHKEGAEPKRPEAKTASVL